MSTEALPTLVMRVYVMLCYYCVVVRLSLFTVIFISMSVLRCVSYIHVFYLCYVIWAMLPAINLH